VLIVERYAAGERWGVGELWVRDGALVHHELPAPARAAKQNPPRGERKPPSGTLRDRVSRVGAEFVPELTARFRAYFAGDRVSFGDVPVDLDWCTDFQLAVARALRDVPYGELVSYGELAALAGHPGAQRAAGTFCARNRFPLVLPCHRVVAATGIGSFGTLGVRYKRRLLRLEGVRL
jgi:O-6-methylguanine DNA methyltransferase